MLFGILWALLAGLMLGLYAIPGKYTKDFKEENTGGLFRFIDVQIQEDL
jgi:L-rhamnose-H+ transport protein